MKPSSNAYVLIGGCLLAFGAAVVNVAFLLQTGTSVSHLTGDIARLGTDFSLASPELMAEAAKVGIAAMSFIIGALFAGVLIHQPDLEIARPYGRTIIFIGSVLLLSDLLMDGHVRVAIALAAFACGIQNALATRYHGVVLRTTHLTGLLTDLGVAFGMLLRRRPVSLHAIYVPTTISLSFLAGAALGGCSILKLEAPVLRFAGASYIVGGLIWSALKRKLFRPEIGKSE